jgi:predicted Holliday junction resolvase-like endonuclease
LLLVVWIAVAVLAVVVLGGLLYNLLGAVQRLRREVAAVQADLRPIVTQAQETMAAAADARERSAGSR